MKKSSQQSRDPPKTEKKEESESQKLTLEDYMNKPDDMNKLLPNETKERRIGSYQLAKESERRNKGKTSMEEELVVEVQKEKEVDKGRLKNEIVKKGLKALKDEYESEEEKEYDHEFEVVDEKEEEENDESEEYKDESFDFSEKEVKSGKRKLSEKENKIGDGTNSRSQDKRKDSGNEGKGKLNDSGDKERKKGKESDNENKERIKGKESGNEEKGKNGLKIKGDKPKITVVKDIGVEEKEKKENSPQIELEKLRIEAVNEMRSESRQSSRSNRSNLSSREYREEDLSIDKSPRVLKKNEEKSTKNTTNKKQATLKNELNTAGKPFKVEEKKLPNGKNSQIEEKLLKEEKPSMPDKKTLKIENKPIKENKEKPPNPKDDEGFSEEEEKLIEQAKLIKSEKPKIKGEKPLKSKQNPENLKNLSEKVSSDPEAAIKLSELQTLLKNSELPQKPFPSKSDSPQNTPKHSSHSTLTSKSTQTPSDPVPQSTKTYEQIIKSQKKELKSLRKALASKAAELNALQEELSNSKSKKKTLKSELGTIPELEKSFQLTLDQKEKTIQDLQNKLNLISSKPQEAYHRKNVHSEADFWSLEDDSSKSELVSLKDIAKNKALWIIKTEEKNKGFVGKEKHQSSPFKPPLGKLKFTRRSLEPLTPKYS